MGLFSWLPWVDDDPKPKKPVLPPNWRTSVSPEVLANSGNPNKDLRTYPAPYAAAQSAARGVEPPVSRGSARPPASRYQPGTATPATQRYLRAAGWTGGDDQETAEGPDPMAGMYEAGTMRDLAPHAYRLTPWQQEQAERDYGVARPAENPRLQGERYRTGRLTEEGWKSLTPQQQKAVEWNTMLQRAVEEDRKPRPTGTPVDRAEYDKKVAAMFGTQGGSDYYAPRTVALLEQMGMDGLRGQDLDEYLSLDKAFTSSEIKNLQPWDTVPEAAGYSGFANARSLEASNALDIRTLDKAGALINRAPGWNYEAQLAYATGGPRPPVDQIPFGFLTEGESRGDPDLDEKEAWIQNAWNALQSKETSNLDDLWAFTAAKEFTDEDYNELFNSFYLMSLEADRVGVTDPQYRTGQEMRDFLGMGG